MIQTDDGLTIHPHVLGGDLWHTYADHRMAQAGALLGLAGARDHAGRRRAAPAKTMPEFVQLWKKMIDDSVAGVSRRGDRRGDARGLRGDEYEAFERPGVAHQAPHEGPARLRRRRDRHGHHRRSRSLSTPDRRTGDVTATKARQLGRTGVIVGDQVRVVGDTSGDEGTLARIVEVEERETVLRRTADDDDPYERPIVANADQLVIVTALADPPPRVGMIDRILVAGYDAGIGPLLCLTKADLAAPDELVAALRSRSESRCR